MRNKPWLGRKFWLNAGLGLSVAGMPWTAAISLLGTSTIATLLSTPVQAAMLSSWEFNPSTQELSVTVPGGTTPRYFLAAEPARIVLDLPDTEIGTVPLQQTYGGAVREIRVAQFEPGVTRIVLELAPGTVLAPGHVELQQAGAAPEGDRWILRPLLATNASVAMSTTPATPSVTPVPAADAALSSTVELPPLEPGATEIPVEPPPDTAATVPPPGTATSPPASVGMDANSMDINQSDTDSPESVRMPFAEPTTSEAMSEAETADETETAEDASEAAITLDSPESEDTNPEAVNPESANSESATPEAVSLPNSPDSAVASLPALPEASSSVPTPSGTAVSVPALDAEQAEPQSSPRPLTPTRPQASSSPQDSTADSSASGFPTPTISSTDSPDPASDPTSDAAIEPESLPSPSGAEAVSAQSSPVVSPPTRTAAIEFGQPLPKSAANSLPSTAPENSIAAANHNNAILLPAGTTLNLRYTGEEPLELVAGEPRQEVLVLAEAVHDEAGNIVLPEGSYVMGRFETGESGSQFIAQAISLQGQSITLAAQSEPLSDQQTSRSELLRNSALGVAAGVALGLTGIGLIPAIAAGAATTAGITFLPESKSNVVRPDQVLEVRLMQALQRTN